MFGKRFANNGLLVLAAALFISAGQLLAQSTLKVVPASGTAGSDVTVKVALTSDVSIAAVEFKVTYDKTKLTLKEVARGAAATGMTMTDPTVFVVDSTGGTVGTQDGVLVVQMIDSTLANPIQSGTDREVLLLTFTIGSSASGTSSIALSDASLSNQTGSPVTVSTTDGDVTIGQPTDVDLSVTDVQGPAGANVTVTVKADAAKNIYAMQFSLMFDQSKVTLKSTMRGADAPGVDTLDMLDSLQTANANGKIEVTLVDFYLLNPTSNPLTAGQNREVYKFTFQIGAGVADNTEIPITISGVELGGIENDQETELTYTVHAGKITVGGEPGDVDGNGKTDIFDLLGLLKVLGGSQPSSALSDVDGNGKTDIFDLLALLKKLAG